MKDEDIIKFILVTTGAILGSIFGLGFKYLSDKFKAWHLLKTLELLPQPQPDNVGFHLFVKNNSYFQQEKMQAFVQNSIGEFICWLRWAVPEKLLVWEILSPESIAKLCFIHKPEILKKVPQTNMPNSISTRADYLMLNDGNPLMSMHIGEKLIVGLCSLTMKKSKKFEVTLLKDALKILPLN